MAWKSFTRLFGSLLSLVLFMDLKPVQEMLTSKGISWPQVSDADKTLQKLFNVKGTPTYYLLDRDGKIAAKNLPSFKRLSVAIDDLLKKR